MTRRYDGTITRRPVIRGRAAGAVNATHDFSSTGFKMDAIYIVNRSTTDTVTFTINGISIDVAAGETFEGEFAQFQVVDVLATDNYELVVLGI